MKRLLCLLYFMLFCSFALSQENTYQITYENFYELSEDGLESEFDDKDTRDFYRELWTRKKVFHLITNKEIGFFHQEQHLEDQKTLNSSDGSILSFDNTASDLYLNFKQKTWFQTTDIRNTFIKDSLQNFHWSIQRETENVPQIFGLKTMKAEIDLGDGMLITAFYAPEIPISAGPDKYSGLPGLILYLEMRLIDPEVESSILANIWQASKIDVTQQEIPTLNFKRNTTFMSSVEYQNFLEENMQKQQDYNAQGVERMD